MKGLFPFGLPLRIDFGTMLGCVPDQTPWSSRGRLSHNRSRTGTALLILHIFGETPTGFDSEPSAD